MKTSKSSRPSVKAFCVGQAKSGTASVYGLLAKHYRTVHEPERDELLGMILREAFGEVDEQGFCDYLIRRDQRLDLEYDIAWANQFLVKHLLTAFPDARFIVLIRDPYTWLNSMVGHLISRQIPPAVRSFLDWWFKPERYPHTNHDRSLESEGVYSVAAFMNAWNRHVDLCTRAVPPERRLVIRTHELDQSLAELASFLQVPLESLDTQKGHLNRRTWSGRLDSLVDDAYLADVIGRTCASNMAEHFPELSEAADVSQLWKHASRVDGIS